jgi:hypothetical protein
MNKLIKFICESDIDEGFGKGTFFRLHSFPKTAEGRHAEKAHLEKQTKLIEQLERCLQDLYGDRVFVSDDVWLGEILKLEIGSEDLAKTLLVTIGKFLLEQRSSYCVSVTVYGGSLHDKGELYMGRILISARGIVVEDSLKVLFVKRFGNKG